MMLGVSVSDARIDRPGRGVLGRPSSTRKPSVRAWLSARVGWAGLVGLLSTGLVIAVSAGRTGWLLPPSSRPVPGSLAGVFGRSGIDLELGGLIAVLMLMFVSYVAAIWGADRLSPRAVLIAVAGLNAVLLLAPPLFSTDVFSYMAYGRIGAMYGANPYLHGPNASAVDPAYTFIAARWVATPTVYGPLFTAMSYVLAPLNVGLNVLAYKVIAAASSLAMVVVVWKASRVRGVNPVRAVVLVGLNPVIVVYGVGGGHNDLLMLALLLTGVYVLLRNNGQASGALIVAATAVKLTAGILLPFVFAHNARGRGGRGLRAVLVGVAAAAVLGGALSFVFFGSGPFHLASTLEQVQHRGGLNSFSGLLLRLFGLGHLGGPVGLVLQVAFAICVAWLVLRVWRGELDWITGAGWATAALLVTAGLLLPWYVGWLVPFAALSTDRRLAVTAVVLTGVGLTTL
jgi:Glycosyltransferase family 87